MRRALSCCGIVGEKGTEARRRPGQCIQSHKAAALVPRFSLDFGVCVPPGSVTWPLALPRGAAGSGAALMQRQCCPGAAGGATMHTALPAGQRQRARSCAVQAALLPEPPDRSAAGSAAVASWQRRCHRCEAGASGLAAVLPAGIAVSGGGGPLHCDRAGAAVPQHYDRRADSGP